MRGLLRWTLGFVALYVGLLGVGYVSELPHGAGVLAVVAFFLVIAGAIRWLAGAGQRGPRSDKDLRRVGSAAAAGTEHMGPGQPR